MIVGGLQGLLISVIFTLNIDLQSKRQVEWTDFSFVISFKPKSVPQQRFLSPAQLQLSDWPPERQ